LNKPAGYSFKKPQMLLNKGSTCAEKPVSRALHISDNIFLI
jgi:hypothetical protein